MPTLTAVAVLRPYRVVRWRPQDNVERVRVLWRQGREGKTKIIRGCICRLCGRVHRNWHFQWAMVPTDKRGLPLVCDDCYQHRLSKKMGTLPEIPQRGSRKRAVWFDRATLYATARLYLQEYEKRRASLTNKAEGLVAGFREGEA